MCEDMRKLDKAKRSIAICNDTNIIDLLDRRGTALCLNHYLNHLFSDKQYHRRTVIQTTSCGLHLSLHQLKHKDSCHSFINHSLCYLSLFTSVFVCHNMNLYKREDLVLLRYYVLIIIIVMQCSAIDFI